MDWRAERMAAIFSVHNREPKKSKEKNDKRMNFIREYVKFDLEILHLRHGLNNSKHSSDEAAGIIINAMKTRGLIQ
jgi:hypothetical protein